MCWLLLLFVDCCLRVVVVCWRGVVVCCLCSLFTVWFRRLLLWCAIRSGCLLFVVVCWLLFVVL